METVVTDTRAPSESPAPWQFGPPLVVTRGAADRAPIVLTRRELQVLVLLCHRLTDQEIADRLSISRRTASCHVASILDKLRVGNRREAATTALMLGLA